MPVSFQVITDDETGGVLRAGFSPLVPLRGETLHVLGRSPQRFPERMEHTKVQDGRLRAMSAAEKARVPDRAGRGRDELRARGATGRVDRSDTSE